MAKKAKQTAKRPTEFGPIQLKVSEKGAISVYGIRRFPITFYRSEWEWLASKMEAILDYGERHADELKAEVEGGGKAIDNAETA